jgi:hypothetical protein
MKIYIYDSEVYNENIREEDRGRTRAIRDMIFQLKTEKILEEGAKASKDVYILRPLDCKLVSGYGELCKQCTLNIGFQPISNDKSIYFIHTSNKCFYRFVSAILNCNNTRSWIVCYSGDLSTSYKAIESKFPSRKNIEFYPYIATYDDIISKWDIPAFVQAVKETKDNPFDYLERTGTPHLIALSILCQGYLAAHGTKDSLNGWEDVWNKLGKAIKDHRKKYKLVASKMSITETKDWWRKAIGAKQNNIMNELSTIAMDKSDEKTKIKSLIEIIYKSDGPALPKGTLVADAYTALVSIFKS